MPEPSPTNSSTAPEVSTIFMSNPRLGPLNPGTSSEEPLDIAFERLCIACRTGDYESADTLLLDPNTKVNQVDEWDYSPLILASLCGHYDLVELLLSRGAVCDRDTFEGARCIHGALNDKIRDLLLSYDISKKVDITQPFAAHLSSLLNPRGPQEKIQAQSRDVVLILPHVQGVLTRDLQSYNLNRFLLAARLNFFKELLKNDVSSYKIPEVDPSFFEALINYVYLKTDLLPLEDPKFQEFAKQFELQKVAEVASEFKGVEDQKELAKLKNEASATFMEGARDDMKRFLEDEIISSKVVKKVIVRESDIESIELGDYNFSQQLTEKDKQNFMESGSIADVVICVVEEPEEDEVEEEAKENLDSKTDLKYGDSRLIFHYYPAHKAVLSRLPFFKTMFESEITSQTLPKVEIDGRTILERSKISEMLTVQLYTLITSSEVCDMVLSFLYHDDVPNIPPELVVQLLFAANELLLDKLKARAAVALTSLFSEFSRKEWDSLTEVVGMDGFDLIRVAWDTSNDRIEQNVSKLIAYNLEYISSDIEQRLKLCDLIRESASRISERQDTDTIELVDDIRYYLVKKYRIGMDDPLDSSSENKRNPKTIEENLTSGSIWSSLLPEGSQKAVEDIRLYKNALLQYNADQDIIESLLEEVDLEA